MNKYSVLKLSNGEDIICRIVEASKEKIKVENPLLLDVQQTPSRDGRVKETLGLVKWIKPFTDEEEYYIEKNSIVITVSASSGLSKFYEDVLRKLNNSIIKQSKIEPMSDVAVEDDLESLSDEELFELVEESKNRTVH